MPKKYEICYTDELPPGERRIVTVAGRSIGIFNLDSEYFALRNSCPHKGAPLCKGIVDGLIKGTRPGDFCYEKAGEILRCPWHGWEFDLRTGESTFNPHKVKVRNYPTSVEADEEPDPSIETFAVTVESTTGDGRTKLYVHV